MIPPQLQDLLDALQECETLREKFSFIIELGDELPILNEENEKEKNKYKLKGCASNAWLRITEKDEKIFLSGEAEAQISKGMLGFLALAFDGLTKKEITNIPTSALEENPLITSLSPSRSNGALSAIEQVRKFSQEKTTN